MPERMTLKEKVDKRWVEGPELIVDGKSHGNCWTWTGEMRISRGTDHLYGKLTIWDGKRNRSKTATHAVWEVYTGQRIFWKETQLDHKFCEFGCDTTCVNPTHLEPVTPKEHSKRTRERKKVYK